MLIDAAEAVKIIKRYDDRGLTLDEVTRITDGIAKEIEAMPKVDAVEVVRCHECIMHNKCNTEEAYKLCRIENPFCCAGKRREPVRRKLPEEEYRFLMNRFMRQE